MHQEEEEEIQVAPPRDQNCISQFASYLSFQNIFTDKYPEYPPTIGNTLPLSEIRTLPITDQHLLNNSFSVHWPMPPSGGELS